MRKAENHRNGSFVIVRAPTKKGEEERIWLVKHAYGAKLWSLAGGGVNSDEHPSEAAKREAEEELQTDIVIARIIGVFRSRKNPGTFVFLYLGRDAGNSVVKDGDGGEIAGCYPWRPPKAIASELVYPAQRLLIRAWKLWERTGEQVDDWLSEPVRPGLKEPTTSAAAR